MCANCHRALHVHDDLTINFEEHVQRILAGPREHTTMRTHVGGRPGLLTCDE